jgi:hypothetical protein
MQSSWSMVPPGAGRTTRVNREAIDLGQCGEIIDGYILLPGVNMASQGKSSALKWVLGLLLVVIVAGFAIEHLLSAWNERVNEQRITARWEEFRNAAVVSGTALVADPARQDTDYSAAASRLLALYNNRTLTFQNPELTKAWAQIETETGAGMQILNRIGAIDQTKPSGYQILANAVQNDPEANREAGNDFISRLASEFDKASLEQQFRQTADGLEASIGTLGQAGDGLTHGDMSNALAVQYLPSWDGTYWGDLLKITNTTGNALQNAVVVATVRQSDGSSRVHVHYVDQWQAGATLEALYPYGSTDYADAETGNRPENVDVALYVRNGEARSSYALTPQEWEKRVQGYSGGVSFTGHYLGSYSDTNGSYPPGFQLHYEGNLPTLPVTSVEVRFSYDTNSAIPDYVWTPSGPLASGTEYPIRNAALSGDNPGHIDLTVHFAETDYAAQTRIF